MGDSFLDRPDGRLAYDVSGEGPLVVLMPGLGDVRSTYRFLAPALVAAGYRVATVDLRGHGASDTTFASYDDVAAGGDLIALVRHLGGGPVTLVGSSMAAGAAVWAAAEEPHLVSGTVLLGPYVRNPPASWTARLVTGLVLRKPWGIAATGAFIASLHKGTRPPDLAEHVARIKASLRRPGAWQAFRRTAATSHEPVTPRLSEVTAPALIVMGERDPDFADPRAEAEFVAGALGGPATVTMVPDAGHYPHSQRPDLVAPAVIGHLGAVAAG
ncbi:alpha-beta hydrolase superfamily lysophospholipase [Haloactinopolyspora alba]|uniref:Alpha-beta hydrolase superfamily lysophospholipase n=1 Tax=Haloactinopolyspora alba TaxID=648780 RepID=A0A2P8E741_9ACTN|nr:alpha/beta hydrolase [Haloactinopolyspora alba]PSL05258.1 alpha-beta hydrolase superfamily lysophospholipase [Haloactinopolyspora alba]